MKLKTLLIILNIVLVAIIVLCFFSFFLFQPLPADSSDSSGLPAAFAVSVFACAVLFAAFVCADIFILRRAKMFDALMAENWPALSLFFEREMLEKGRFSKRGLELFISVLVLLSDYETLCALFSKLKKEKPDLYRLFAPDFIAASIVFGNADGAKSCISSVLNEGCPVKEEEREWAEFYSAFLAFRAGKYSPAAEGFAALASSAGNAVARAVSGYFCARLISAKAFGAGSSTEALLAVAEEAREKTRGAYTPKRWQELCAKARKKVRAAVIGKTIASASEWLFKEDSAQKMA